MGADEKGTVKDHCELIFRKYSDRAGAGHKVDADIPHVGKLAVSIGIAAIVFKDSIIKKTRGRTAINYV